MPVTDLLLWKRFIGGDEEAYAYIYRQYVDSLYSYASCFIMISAWLRTVSRIYLSKSIRTVRILGKRTI